MAELKRSAKEMARKNKSNEVSVGYWMFAVLVTALPLVNLIMIPLLAFTGSNQTKKNYYRAILAWFVLIVCIHLAVLLTISWPKLLETLKGWVT